MNGKGFIDCIKIDDYLEINQNTLNINDKNKNHIKVYILCEKTIVNYPQINIINFIKGSISDSEKYLIKNSYLKLNFTSDEIINLNEHKKEIFLVNKEFLLNKGINPSYESSLKYFNINSKKILFFTQECISYIIESRNKINIFNPLINIIINPNNSNNKMNNFNNINQRNMNMVNNLSIINNNNASNNNNNVVLRNSLNQMNNINFNGNINPYLNNQNQMSSLILDSLILLYANNKEINDIFSGIKENYKIKKYVLINKRWFDDLKSCLNYNEINNLFTYKFIYNNYDDYINNLKYLHSLKEFQNIEAKLKTNVFLAQFNKKDQTSFEEIDNKLNIKLPVYFELINESLFNVFKRYIPNINEHQIKYNAIFGKTTLYLQSQNNYENNYIYIYIYSNINKTFILYAICIFKDLKMLKNIYDKYLKVITFEEYLKIKDIKLNILNQRQNILSSNGVVFAQVILIDKNNQFNKNCQMNQIIQINQKNENGEFSQNENKIFNNNYLISINYQNFLQELENMIDLTIGFNLSDIENYLNQRTIISYPVYLFETEKLNYYLKTRDELIKNKQQMGIQQNNFDIDFNIFNNIIKNNIIKNKSYSVVNETILKDLKFPIEKYNNSKGLIFKNKGKIFLYSMESKILLILIKKQNNIFELSEKHINNSQNGNNQSKKPEDSGTSIIEPSNPPLDPQEPPHCLGLENIGAMSRAFVELINNVWIITYETYYAPYNFKNLISKLNPLFSGIQANDSKDLIIFIYETLHNELNNPESNNKILEKLNNQNIPNDLKLFRQNYYSQNYSIITNIFYSEQTSNLLCKSCNCNKVSYNIYNFLIFPLEKIRLYLVKTKPHGLINVTLLDCFEQNEEQELLCGMNQIYCNNCKRQSDALSFNRLYNCPEVLTIILNRGKGLQFSVEFKFPMLLDIDKYVIDKSCGTKYELIGVITHLGESGMSGHFIAYCKSSPGDKNWYCFNDALVNKCKDPEEEINSRGIPYVLYYQKIKNNENRNNENKNNEKSNNQFILYFKYDEKGGYLETNENEMLIIAINKFYSKYSLPEKEGNTFHIEKGNNLLNLDPYKTLIENKLQSEDTIIIA